MNDALHAANQTTEASPKDEADVGNAASQVMNWVKEHPVTALAVAGAVGATLGAVVLSTATRRTRAGDGGSSADDGASHGTALRTLLGGAAAVAVASLRKWSAEISSGEPDPIADLADTDQFAQAPEAPPDAPPATAPVAPTV